LMVGRKEVEARRGGFIEEPKLVVIAWRLVPQDAKKGGAKSGEEHCRGKGLLYCTERATKKKKRVPQKRKNSKGGTASQKKPSNLKFYKKKKGERTNHQGVEVVQPKKYCYPGDDPKPGATKWGGRQRQLLEKTVGPLKGF